MTFDTGDVVKVIGQNVPMTVVTTISKRTLKSENAPDYIKSQLGNLNQMFASAGNPAYMVLCCWFNTDMVHMSTWISSEILESVNSRNDFVTD